MANLTKPLIRALLVEDDPVAAGLLQAQVRADTEADWELRLAGSLEEAFAALADAAVDVIALDLMLPDSGGLETLERVRREAPGIPVVVLTGLEQDGLGETARRHGAHDVVRKGRPGRPVARILREAAGR